MLVEGRQLQQTQALAQQVVNHAAGREVVALHQLADAQVDVSAHLGLDEVAACQRFRKVTMSLTSVPTWSALLLAWRWVSPTSLFRYDPGANGIGFVRL